MINKINLKEQVNSVSELFSYLKIGHINNHMLNVLQVENRTLDFHVHDNSDEMFYCIEGEFDIEFTDELVHLYEGDFIIVPKGTLHRPICKNLVKCLLIEIERTLTKENTGRIYKEYKYEPATLQNLEKQWDKNIADNSGDGRWIEWRNASIEDNKNGFCKTFVVMCEDEPVGEGTLVFSPQSGAIRGRTKLADNAAVANINALRIDKQYEGKGHISKLVKYMEHYAKNAGYKTITIGVEPHETRNLGIYLHWGYNTFIMSDVEEFGMVLYYSKSL